MKTDNLFIALLKKLGTSALIMCMLLAGFAGWQLLEAGPQRVFASKAALDAYIDNNLSCLLMAVVFAAPIFALAIPIEIMKRKNFDLETLNDDYSGPRESLILRAFKQATVWILVAGALTIGFFIFEQMAGRSFETSASASWPIIIALLACVVPLVLIDTLGTSLQRWFEDRKPSRKKQPSHLA